ncbi:MAG TPA: hydantoinase B/oxoprolinase family protein, partial [Candidatus Dormibacteraeota bacterium]|nr:hydantoinase B/oxoprolinase family protein [Candidatus Dormibacteraeota bacterium]
AVFDAARNVLAMGDHMPVHLGSMPMSVAAALDALRLGPGDVALLNDPYAGGTHLPDLTMVMPVYFAGSSRPLFYVANRAHHADIGGAHAGSMGMSREIFQEGLRIPSVKIMERGRIVPDIMSLILANVRTPDEREGDLTAQIAACRIGERRLTALVSKYGKREAAAYGRHLLDYSETMMAATIGEIPDGVYRGEDFLDDDGVTEAPLRIAVTIRVRGRRAEVDFTGSAPQCAGSVNAVAAITWSAVFYVFRCLIDEQVPATSGLMRPIRVVIPRGTVVNALAPAAVAGGNVETSQRIVDTLLRALARAIPARIPAASQGTMNNLTFGGRDSRYGGAPFAYYETIAGGTGAGAGVKGSNATQSHMTNTLNTPIEVLEHAYPVRVRRYALVKGSGGDGRFPGGNGIVREIEMLTDVQAGILSDRRKLPPYGLAGGEAGAMGNNEMVVEGRTRRLPSKCSFYAPAGSLIRIQTPGGGGWGRAKKVRRKEKSPSA